MPDTAAPPAPPPAPAAAVVPTGGDPGPDQARRSASTWVSTTYFAEGLPMMVVRSLSGVYLTDVGVKELYLGFLNFLALPWNLKFLWAPAVDIFGTKRGWLLKVEAALVVLVGLMGACVWGGPDVVHAATSTTSAAAVASLSVRLLAVVLVAAAFVAATHDVAIDGFYMEAITGQSEQAAYTGLRVMTYRFAMIFTKSGLVAVAAWLTWRWSFFGAAVTLAMLLAFHAFYLPRPQRPRIETHKMGETLQQFARAFRSYLAQPGIALVLLFLITYKLGDEVLFSMHTPFLMRELGVSKVQLSWINGMLGAGTGIAGSLVSAWAIRRYTLQRAIWPLTLGMNVNIWVYVWLAWNKPDPHTAAGLTLIAVILAYEQFAAGLGNAVLVVYAMRTCRVEFKAAHFAIATAIASLGGTLCGGFGGAIVEHLGYVWLFVLAFVLSIPSMVCLLRLPLREQAAPATTK